MRAFHPWWRWNCNRYTLVSYMWHVGAEFRQNPWRPAQQRQRQVARPPTTTARATRWTPAAGMLGGSPLKLAARPSGRGMLTLCEVPSMFAPMSTAMDKALPQLLMLVPSPTYGLTGRSSERICSCHSMSNLNLPFKSVRKCGFQNTRGNSFKILCR